jgi:hypothetical protein
MNRKTRYFLIGSGLIVAVGLGTGLVASYTGQFPGAGLARQSEFSYLPADATAVAYADVQDIMASEFRQRLHEFLPTGTEKDKFLQETGIDIEKDIDSVVAGLTTSEPAGVGPLVLLRGRFDPVRIEALATQHGGTVQDYRGKRLFVAPHFRGDDEVASDGTTAAADSQAASPSMVFLENDLIALGRVDAIRKAIDKSQDSAGTQNDELMDLVSEVSGSGNAWVVGRFDRLAASPNIPDNVRSHLPGIEWVAVSADIGTGVNGFMRAEAKDDAAGEQLRSVINGALAAARMFGGQDPKVEAALRSVQATGSGRTAQVSFAVGPELLDLMQGMHTPR